MENVAEKCRKYEVEKQSISKPKKQRKLK